MREQPQAGVIGFSTIAGRVGELVKRGQDLLLGLEEGEDDIRHVYVCIGDGTIVQAMPSGAERVPLSEARLAHDVFLLPNYYNRGGPVIPGGRYVPTGERVAQAALRYVGTPYSFLDYAALLSLHKLPWAKRFSPLRHYVKSSGRMICSQLADQALTDAGYHAFNDGRLPQDVMPVELYRQLLLQGAARLG